MSNSIASIVVAKRRYTAVTKIVIRSPSYRYMDEVRVDIERITLRTIRQNWTTSAVYVQCASI